MKPSPLNLLEFAIKGYGYKLKKNYKPCRFSPESEMIDFSVIPKQHKERKSRFMCEFNLKLKGKKTPVTLNVEGFAVVEFPENFKEKKVKEMIFFAVFPMIYSTLRGYVLSATLSAPVSVVLPLVNIIDSLKEEEENRE
jgi:hypothetical protein